MSSKTLSIVHDWFILFFEHTKSDRYPAAGVQQMLKNTAWITKRFNFILDSDTKLKTVQTLFIAFKGVGPTRFDLQIIETKFAGRNTVIKKETWMRVTLSRAHTSAKAQQSLLIQSSLIQYQPW